MPERKPIDYYIFLDYSERLVGYVIIEKEQASKLLPKISKLHHYKNIKNKRAYIKAAKKILDKNKVEQHILKSKSKELKDNLPIFVEVIEFIKKHNESKIFISIDDNQYSTFNKLLEMIPHKDHIMIVKESKLKKGSKEYKMNLITDTKLNIERMSK